MRRVSPGIRTGVWLLLGSALSGCAMVGPHSLKADQVDYARALGEGKKREIVALAVGLRYADLPSFLNVTQIIAAYTVDGSISATANAHADPSVSATGTLGYSNHPTFTFTPTTGEYFAKAYIHPLAPSVFMPLANTGVPIDLLLRISVQSIGRLQNATILGGASGDGSPGFFELLRLLRQVQLAGELSVHDKINSPGAVMLTLGVSAGPSPQAQVDIARIHTLLNLPPNIRDFELMVGGNNGTPGQLSVVTRSVLAVLSDIGGEINVPAADIRSGATTGSIRLVGDEARPLIIVHASPKAPQDAYIVVPYRDSEFWIDDKDFDSKYALTVVQDLMALAEVPDTSHNPVVTVPAN